MRTILNGKQLDASIHRFMARKSQQYGELSQTRPVSGVQNVQRARHVPHDYHLEDGYYLAS